uniref:Ig-like domain-containing protein n=1 Tax=Paramormyrops kingsleyae TaxID=1676925 RepID=A0A3B3RXX1_9TELE
YITFYTSLFRCFLLHGSADPLTAQLRGAVLLPCFVDRPLPLEELEVEWRRTDSDTIVHLLQGGQSRPESQGDAYKDRAHFFSQEIHKGNFSLLLEGVRTADAGVYKCVAYTEQEQNETQVVIQGVVFIICLFLLFKPFLLAKIQQQILGLRQDYVYRGRLSITRLINLTKAYFYHAPTKFTFRRGQICWFKLCLE